MVEIFKDISQNLFTIEKVPNWMSMSRLPRSHGSLLPSFPPNKIALRTSECTVTMNQDFRFLCLVSLGSESQLPGQARVTVSLIPSFFYGKLVDLCEYFFYPISPGNINICHSTCYPHSNRPQPSSQGHHPPIYLTHHSTQASWSHSLLSENPLISSL